MRRKKTEIKIKAKRRVNEAGRKRTWPEGKIKEIENKGEDKKKTKKTPWYKIKGNCWTNWKNQVHKHLDYDNFIEP